MLNLKKTAVAVLAFGSSAVFAGTMGPVCTPGSVTVPCPGSAWDFGVQALYLKPSYSGYLYQSAFYSDDFLSETYGKTPTKWGWGFKLEASYHFSTGNDLNLNWYHFNNSSTADVGFFPSDVLEDTFVVGQAQPRWDAVNLEFGQHAHFGEWKNIRFHGGVQFASIRLKTHEHSFRAETPDVDLGGFSDLDITQKYNGFGPRIGADYWYNWGNGFAMYANGATALLVGTQSFTSNYYSESDGQILVDNFGSTGSVTAIVPELEAKLGLKYTYAMAQGDFSIDAGWMWVNYWDVMHTAPASSFGVGVTKETNFAVQGPFVGLKWIGNVA